MIIRFSSSENLMNHNAESANLFQLNHKNFDLAGFLCGFLQLGLLTIALHYMFRSAGVIR